MKIERKDTVAIIRSAHIGDFLVCIPFIEHLINDIGLLPQDIHFIIINDSKINPVKLCFGEFYFPVEHIHILDNNARLIYRNSMKIRKAISGGVTHVLYLPFANEKTSSVLKKYLTLKLIFGFSKVIHGIGQGYHATSPSQYLSLFERYGISYVPKRSYLKFLKLAAGPEQDKVSQLFPIVSGRRFAVYPHSKLIMKVWPQALYIALIKQLVEKYNPTIYLIGSKEDYEYNQQIVEALQNENNTIVNVAGFYSLRESICFLSRMDLVIGNDGAPLHMAALANAPIVGIFTHKEPAGAWDPVITEKLVIVRQDVDCKECYRVQCDDVKCLNTIDTKTVMDSIRLMIGCA